MTLRYELQGWVMRFYREGAYFHKLLKELDKTAKFNQAELKAYQEQHLQRMIHHCADNVPYYQDLFRSLGLKAEEIRTVADLQKLPLLDKNTVMDNFDRLISKKHRNILCRVGTTSGTSGRPGRFLRDYHSINFENAATWRYWRQAGDYGKKRITLRGSLFIPVTQTEPPFWRYNPASKELQMSSFHMSMQNSKAYVDEILKFQPRILYCLPSNGALLAKFFRHYNVDYQLDAIFTSSESLEPEVRNYIEEVFQCQIYDWYGQAERVAAIAQCAHQAYHIQEDYSIVELLPNSEDGSNEIIGTQLQNYVMPLLRYRTNDHVFFSGELCTCGSSFRKVDKLLGRFRDFILTPDGRKISITSHISDGIDALMEMQLVQERPGEVIVNIVTNGHFTANDKARLIANTQNYTSSDMQVRVNEVEEIPRGPNGKFISIVNKLEHCVI